MVRAVRRLLLRLVIVFAVVLAIVRLAGSEAPAPAAGESPSAVAESTSSESRSSESTQAAGEHADADEEPPDTDEGSDDTDEDDTDGAERAGSVTTGDQARAARGLDQGSSRESRGVVALTFDDGPSPDHTGAILAMLRTADASATFFVVGAQVAGREHLVRELVNAGMSVQWHTQTHPDLTRLDDAELRAELAGGHDVLSPLGIEPHCVRAPYGAHNSRTDAAAADAGLQVVGWTVDPRDWDNASPGQIVDSVMAQVRDGSIVLLHDGGGDRANTVAALGPLLKRLAAEGYDTAPLCTSPGSLW